MQEEYNPDDSMAEAELELALGRLKLSKKKVGFRVLTIEYFN